MSDIINNLKNNPVIKTEIADVCTNQFDKLQLSIFIMPKTMPYPHPVADNTQMI